MKYYKVDGHPYLEYFSQTDVKARTTQENIENRIKITRNKDLKHFTSCVINLYKIWVLVSKWVTKNGKLLHVFFFF